MTVRLPAPQRSTQKRARVRGGTTTPRRASRIPILMTVRSSFTQSLIALLLAQQRPPGLAVAVGAVRADPLDHLADQLVGELLLAAGALDPELHGGGDVAPGRLAVDADPVGDGALALTLQPAPQRLFDLDHRYLPERHGASSASGFGGPAECLFGRRWWTLRVVP